MHAVTTKQRILVALSELPENASIEDAIERLRVLANAEKGRAQLEAEQNLDHDEVKRRLGL